jgi:hypothetical protein
MEQACVRCGKIFEGRFTAAGAVCPACAASSAQPAAAPVRARITGTDIVVAALVLTLLGLLVWLFLRPEDRARDIVFGDLGRRNTLSNAVATNAAPGAPAPAGEQGMGGVGGGGMPVASNQPGAGLRPDQVRADQSAPNTLASGAPANGSIENGRSPNPSASPSSTAPTSSGASQPPSQTATPATTPPPAPASPPRATSSLARHARSEPFEEAPPPDPTNKNSTAELLAEAKVAAAPPKLPRTADLLGNDSAPGSLFDARTGSNVVFILDNSMDMMTNGKSLLARQELVQTLQSMNAGQTFYVLLFHSGGYEGMPSLSPIAATPQNVQAMTNWLFSVGHRTGADPTKAMLRALGLVPAPDTVWLLSGSALPNGVVDNIREANAFVNAHVNTIGFYNRDGEQELRRIADENRGAYRFVPAPNPSAP